MLELVDLTKKLSKAEYEKVCPPLEIRLGELQRAARTASLPVVILFDGWDAAGKGTAINRLTQALDPRGFKVHPIFPPTDAERFYPWMWRFWTQLPAAGSIGIFDHSWYGRILYARVQKRLPRPRWEQAYQDIEEFERQLAQAGAVLIKLWLHISKAEQKKRFKRLEKNPATAWKVTRADWRDHRRYEKYAVAVEEMLARTSAATAPWTIVEATDARYARVKVFETIANAIQAELDRRAAAPKPALKPMATPAKSVLRRSTILDRVDLTVAVDRERYERELDQLHERLFLLEHELYIARTPAIIAFEGWDAAGKGGVIKRLTRGLDPRGYEVAPIAAPSTEEKAHHYLWRFWRAIPKAGHITIFDRSWYGRVLVERVEGFCTEDEWKRAFREINEFERQLADYGAAVVKFWLHISPQEQLRRFKERQRTPYKQWKITDEDWRNREKWPQYRIAVNDMLTQTSTPHAPWTILEANCKLHARVKALRTVADALEAALKRA
jgi:polyphosphate kinase 2 (PPK2 family)